MSEEGYEDREGQQNMSFDILEAIKYNKKYVVIEAGVGIGKSFAYLFPLMYYYKYFRKPFLISTSTITLQDQLQKDISRVSEMLDIPIKVETIKGKSNYICEKNVYKLSDINLRKEITSTIIKNKEKIDRMYWTSISDKKWNNISANNCEFDKCKYYNQCEFIKKRKAVLEHNGPIICNHDLLLENQKKLESNKLLADSEIIVIDEAHNLEAKARNSFKSEFSYAYILQVITKSISSIKGRSGFNKKQIETKLKTLFYMLKNMMNSQLKEYMVKNKIIDKDYNYIDMYKIAFNNKVCSIISNLYSTLNSLNYRLQFDNMFETEYKEKSIYFDMQEIVNFFNEFKEGANSKFIFWLERKNGNIIIEMCPKDVNMQLYKLLFENSKNTKIMVSATINNSKSENEYYNYFLNSIGIDRNDSNLYLSEPKESPFDYEHNTIFYYSNSIADINKKHEQYIEDITSEIVKLINITCGKTLILFTSKSDMKKVSEKLKSHNLEYEILTQSDSSSQDKLKQKFESNINSVLLSTGTFWEGIDIKGKSLSNLIIVRLPFPVMDPIISYKASLTTDYMNEILVPEMIIKLKQGVGRLIRTSTDVGIISILDPRIGDNSHSVYKNTVFENIKTTNVTCDIEKVKKFAKYKIL